VNEIKNIEKHLKMKKKRMTQGTRITSDGLKGHVFEVSLCRMNSWSFHKFKLKLSQRLPGMDLIRNKIWQTSQVNIKTTDGYFLLLFCLMTCDALTNDLKEVLNKVIHNSALSDLRASCLMYTCKLKKLKKPKSDLGKVMEFHFEGGGSSAAKAEGRDSGQL
uniref:Uncharacterized protein n=1 Tax=Oreochromis aureus TaxID=47969 RepID=A0A668RHE6_OREAU